MNNCLILTLVKLGIFLAVIFTYCCYFVLFGAEWRHKIMIVVYVLYDRTKRFFGKFLRNSSERSNTYTGYFIGFYQTVSVRILYN